MRGGRPSADRTEFPAGRWICALLAGAMAGPQRSAGLGMSNAGRASPMARLTAALLCLRRSRGRPGVRCLGIRVKGKTPPARRACG